MDLDHAIALASPQAISRLLPNSTPCRPRLPYSASVKKNRTILFLLLVAVADAIPAAGQSPDPATTLLSPAAVAVNAATGVAYAVDPQHSAIQVYNPKTHAISSVSVVAAPVALVVNPETNRVYVANAEGASVSVLDGSSNTAIATIPVGSNPYAIALDARLNRIFVARTFSDQVAAIDAASDKFLALKTGSADAIAVDAHRGLAYLLGYEDSELKILRSGTDGHTEIFGKVSVGKHPWAMAVDEAAGKLYVTRSGDAALAIVDEDSRAVNQIAVGRIPCALAVHSSTGEVFVVNHGDATVTVIDPRRNLLVATIPVGKRPQAIAIDAKRNRAYVANSHDSTITVIDTATHRALKALPVSGKPYALDVDASSGRIFVKAIAAGLQVLEPRN